MSALIVLCLNNVNLTRLTIQLTELMLLIKKAFAMLIPVSEKLHLNSFMEANPDLPVVEMDTVKGGRNKGKVFLTLDNKTPFDLMDSKDGKKLLSLLQLSPIPPDEVTLSPKLLKR